MPPVSLLINTVYISLYLVADPSASDEPDDDGKVKKKQKTAVSNKQKPTTRVK